MSKEAKKLADVSPEENFRLGKNIEIRNLHELVRILKGISRESFRNHVNEEKNDFSTWIRHSIGDSDLADRLLETKELDNTIKIIQSRIAFLENKIELGKFVSSIDRFMPVEYKEDSIRNEKPVMEALKSMETGKEEWESRTERPQYAKTSENSSAIGNNSEAHTDLNHEKNIMLTVRDTMFGFVLGIVAGFIIGYFIWSGF